MSSNKTSKIGLFFGTFNPIHIGHLIIAEYMVEFTDIEKIWFVVSPHNPFKEKSTLLKDNHRLYMVNLVTEDNNKFKTCDIELKLPIPSYTINTLTYLKEKYPDKNFVLIMGSDNLNTLHKWKNFEKILEDYEIYVYSRLETENSNFKEHPNVKFFNAPLIEISSSFIRNALKNGKNVKYMLADKVYNHIRDMHFYEK